MDGAVVVAGDLARIRYANVQLQPDPVLPTAETGTRYRSAERTARQTGALVIAVSRRRRSISVYRGAWRHVLADPVRLVGRANQALATLADQRVRLDDALHLLSALEFRDRVAAHDVRPRPAAAAAGAPHLGRGRAHCGRTRRGGRPGRPPTGADIDA